MSRTIVKSHLRKNKRRIAHVRTHIRNIKRPTGIGSLWKGPKDIHGPRKAPPRQFQKLWISQQKWPVEKWLTKEDIKKIKEFARKNKLKIKKGFPKNVSAKVGITREDKKLSIQSFMTPIHYGSWDAYKPKIKIRGMKWK